MCAQSIEGFCKRFIGGIFDWLLRQCGDANQKKGCESNGRTLFGRVWAAGLISQVESRTVRRGFAGLLLLANSWLWAGDPPDFSGSWQRGKSRAPGFAFGAPHWTIRQKSSELVLLVGGQTFVFRLDGAESVYIDHSLGDLPNFIRKIRTQAHWEGERLLIERTSFAEQTDASGKVTTTTGAITIVEALTSSPDRRILTADHRGFRAMPPDLVHGKPYLQSGR